MNRTLFVALAIVCGVSALIVASKRAESGAADALVRLQGSTPGTQQIGHANLSGKMMAGFFQGNGTLLTGIDAGNVQLGTLGNARTTGTALNNPNTLVLRNGSGNFAAEGIQATQFVGGGSGITDVNSDQLDGLDSTAFLQTIPVPLTLSASSATHIIKGTNSSGLGPGIIGESTGVSGEGIKGISVGSSGTGVSGVGGQFGVSGTGEIGVQGGSAGTTAIGVYGFMPAQTGSATGGRFDAYGPGSKAVIGTVYSTAGSTYGGYFETRSSTGTGVLGIATVTGATDNPYGVRGQCNVSTLGYAVFATGDMGASGVKPFRIDHPLDPANKYLLHYSSESPFPQNFYNGNVTTDDKGYAWVELPEYFAEINTNFKYILTVVDDMDSEAFVQAKISKKIKDNRFQIRTSAPNVEVSWEVKADRNDLRVRHNRPTDVREKSGPEKGKYQHPEYYGLGPERGMDYDPQSGKAGRNRR